MNKNLLKIGSLAIVAIALTACSKSDYFDDQSETIASQHKAEYAANFVKKFGAVDPNKSWDMASMQPEYSITPMTSSARAITRGTDSYSRTKATGFKVKKDVLQWFFQKIPAGNDNRSKGDVFYATISDKEFTIVPVFQGTASYYWELWMHVDGLENDVKIWAKAEDLSYRLVKDGELTKTGTGKNEGVSDKAYEVEAPAITFSGMPEGNMYFYLKKWNSYSDYKNQKTWTKLSSLKEMMIALNGCPKPDDVPENTPAFIIGCEDNNGSGSDWDYEDLVFMVYGNFEINKPEEVYDTYSKRYLVEDLGSTDDFDFNDIVVDVFEQYKTTIYYDVVNGEKHQSGTDGPHLYKQWAVVRAAGGTLDFTINIGSESWTKSKHITPVTDMLNTGWNGSAIDYKGQLDEFDITNMDWDSENNNITIVVDGRGTNTAGVQTIKFPKEGEVPMIIAVDTDVDWMRERQEVPSDWIKNNDDQDDQEDQGN